MRPPKPCQVVGRVRYFRCARCRQWKSEREFFPKHAGSPRHAPVQPYCRPCQAEYKRTWRASQVLADEKRRARRLRDALEPVFDLGRSVADRVRRRAS